MITKLIAFVRLILWLGFCMMLFVGGFSTFIEALAKSSSGLFILSFVFFASTLIAGRFVSDNLVILIGEKDE